ncbi:tyrosine-type recombinase/integrase [Cesiribacter sp. SM1]|uniref:tyrosine-type recombinase/integrase n=1 Tax=Cesiribacter sp. SM1 TaxID=2861196 RepID=UPI001CD4FEAD|nr:tyrosine-type recombinase/integrase [Cesiribacter sp. SM1]
MDKTRNIKRDLYNISAKTGIGTIYIYYSKGGKIKRFPTGVKASADKWNIETCQPKRGALSKSDAAIVDKIYNTIHQIITDHQYKYNELPEVAHIEQALDKPASTTEDIHELLQEYIKIKQERTEKTSAYSLIYVAKDLKEAEEHLGIKLTLHNLTYDFIQKFVDYCLNVKKKIQANTLAGRIQAIKEFVKWLDKKEISHSIKPENWEKIKKNKGVIVCLEREELDAIIKYQPTNERDQLIKDTIIFLSHTGMRIGDMKQVTRENCRHGKIQIIPEKTKSKNIKAIIPITKNVQDILDKYDYQLPTFNNHVNDFIKAFCKNIPELHKPEPYVKVTGKKVEEGTAPKYSLLSSHDIGRKTFTNLCIQKGVPLTTICGATGHQKIDTIIQHYADKYANALPQLKNVFE